MNLGTHESIQLQALYARPALTRTPSRRRSDRLCYRLKRRGVALVIATIVAVGVTMFFVPECRLATIFVSVGAFQCAQMAVRAATLRR